VTTQRNVIATPAHAPRATAQHVSARAARAKIAVVETASAQISNAQ